MLTGDHLYIGGKFWDQRSFPSNRKFYKLLWEIKETEEIFEKAFQEKVFIHIQYFVGYLTYR